MALLEASQTVFKLKCGLTKINLTMIRPPLGHAAVFTRYKFNFDIAMNAATLKSNEILASVNHIVRNYGKIINTISNCINTEQVPPRQ